jgi:hypothetical protein
MAVRFVELKLYKSLLDVKLFNRNLRNEIFSLHLATFVSIPQVVADKWPLNGFLFGNAEALSQLAGIEAKQ